MSDVGEEWPDFFKLIDAEEHLLIKKTLILEEEGEQKNSRRSHQVPLLLAKIRKLRLHFTQADQDWTLTGPTFPGLMSHDFCFHFHMVGSKFFVDFNVCGSSYQRFRLMVLV